MKFKIQVQAEITVEFDENSQEFKDLFEGYTQAIDGNADYESLAETIASQVSRYGTKEFIEGVGYLKVNGENQSVYSEGKYEEAAGIINIETETDLNGMIEFEIGYTEKI